MRSILSSMLALALALAASSCKDEKAPTCENVAAHVLGLAEAQLEQELKKLPEGQRKVMEERMGESLTEENFVTQCKKQGYSEADLACVMAAKTMAEIASCGDTAAPPAAGTEPAAEAPAAEAPAAEAPAEDEAAAEGETPEGEALDSDDSAE
ncbi:hypothetical protein [Haliangium ochraceum]|uniref:Lipoprotein n=1 Tax=Haliangium ochraceum (strain DSM 14365 / JCM 11303 / SMP-2) TaxID=502025 RepID=D0LFV1_HALO1|nr:hypothetical protein [Haliangium ochraceum]ACY14553.1 hypothetical protein Hoch_2008 [Haliangium ochraceum DSM 14365]